MTDDYGLDLPLVHTGKVRRLYALPDAAASDGRGSGRLLMVASDAISGSTTCCPRRSPTRGRC